MYHPDIALCLFKNKFAWFLGRIHVPEFHAHRSFLMRDNDLITIKYKLFFELENLM